MSFMKLVRPSELRACDLPLIETPFFAADKARRLVKENNHVRSNMHSLFGYDYRGRGNIAETVHRAVKDGELMLVCEGWGGPFSPMVAWQPDDSLPAGGRWRVNDSWIYTPSAIESAVAQLNECGVTPDQLRQSAPWGVGSLKVNMFSMHYRQCQRREQAEQDSADNHRLSLPVGASALVAPVLMSASAAEGARADSSREPSPKIHLEVGLFTDGTMNNAANTQAFEEQLEQECLIPYENNTISREECERRMGLMLGDSYANAPSNVAKLWDLYIEEEKEVEGTSTYRFSIYAPGAGTKTGDDDVLYSAATGMGEAGVVEQVKRAFKTLVETTKRLTEGQPIDRLTLDLFGFSRGAAAARHAAHEINQGENGLLAQMLAENGILWPKTVEIRFVGLFDSVAAIVNPAAGDLLAHNNRNHPVKLYLAPDKVGHAVHLTAAHEHRRNFALNSLQSRDGSLPANFREISLPGVHSDIGGGYGDSQREDVLLSPRLQVPRDRLRWPDKTLQWDNLEAKRQQVEAAGWIGPDNLPVRQSEQLQAWPKDLGPEGPAQLEIVTRRYDHPAPDGRVELVLRMLRQVRGEYSQVALRLMHRLATDSGAPLQDIDTRKADNTLPNELNPILQQILEQVEQGSDAPSLSAEYEQLLLQRYIHYSAHYNGIETLMAGTPAKLEGLHPHAPVLSGERLVYPQTEGE
ncbi:T6SS phospholipase effector Tle1-like catalytic domain-containing protein [Marinobacter shengliensis]|uniref:T6SS phospholipase effector Tle1-like catalytic domain-containing protein n=1 Tax=Marinobacter shengliensis TaxID=1389223 RepID=UPI0035B75E8D